MRIASQSHKSAAFIVPILKSKPLWATLLFFALPLLSFRVALRTDL